MKKVFIYSLLLVSTLSFSQNKTATTEDGKKVILKSDKTWEYDTKSVTVSESNCNLGSDFVEKKVNERLRKHVAVENDCKPEEVKFISMVQEFGSGTYSLCVKGKKMKYKKIGSVFMRAEQDPLKMK